MEATLELIISNAIPERVRSDARRAPKLHVVTGGKVKPITLSASEVGLADCLQELFAMFDQDDRREAPKRK